MSLATAYVVHDDNCFLARSIASFTSAGSVLVFVSRTPWHGEIGGREESARVAPASIWCGRVGDSSS